MNSRLIATRDGVNLFCVESNPSKSEETILFLHGYPDTHSSWEKQFEFFSKDYRILSYDIRGAGKSSAPIEESGYKMEYLLSDVNRVLEATLAENEKVHLVGHDWGSIILWSYLSKKENLDRVQSFMAVACHHPMIFFKNIIGKMFTLQPEKVIEGFHQLIKSYYILLFQVPFVPEFLWRNFSYELWKLLMSRSGLPSSDPLMNLSREEIHQCTIHNVNLYRQILKKGPPALPRIPLDLPIGLVIPEDDLAITPEVYDETESIARNLKTFRIQANHWVHRERPDWFNQTLKGFLKSVR